jgi:hypothetical protein
MNKVELTAERKKLRGVGFAGNPATGAVEARWRPSWSKPAW